MRSVTPSVRLLAVGMALTVLLTGCKAQLSHRSLNKTNEMLAEIEALNGAKHQPDRVKQIRDLVSQANQQLPVDASQAYTTANSAKTQAQATLIAVKSAEAQDLWNQAEEEIRVADTNAGNRIDPDRYQKIQDLRNKGLTARNKNDYDNLIAFSRSIKTEVGTLLSGLKTNADRKQLAAEQKLTELKTSGGPIYAPERVVGVQDRINGALKIATTERDYVLANNQFGEAISEAEKGIEEVKRAKSKERIDEIEKLLATSLGEDARELVPDEYEKVVGLHEKLIADFEQGRFDKVLLSADDLKPRAEALVVNTKRKKADQRLASMKQDIDTLVDAGAREYLPGRVEVVEKLLVEAQETRKQDTEASFDTIKGISQNAADETDKINRAFSDLATEATRVAGTDLDGADLLFEQSGKIFDAVASEVMSQDEKVFEGTKETRRGDIRSRLKQSREDLLVSDLRQKEKKYKMAIQLAEEQGRKAKAIVDEIFHVTAHNAAIELANLVSRYERDGAREYANEELKHSTDDLADVKSLIAGARYREATSSAASARANVELMAQRIAGRAVEDLSEARETARDASSERTQKYRADKLAEVQGLINQAEKDLQAQRLKLAVENANRAINLAKQAKAEAAQLAAQDGIAAADQKIARATSSGAAEYAGREVEDAKKLANSARTLFASQDYDKSEDLASSAISRADQAFYKKVNDAEAALSDAKSVGGWNYANETLSLESANLAEARRQLESGHYSESAKLADGARAACRSVATMSKRRNFEKAVDRINGDLATAKKQGLDYFQAKESIDYGRKLLQVENQYSDEKYEYTMAELEKLEGGLRETMNQTGRVVETIASQQEKRLAGFVESGAADYAGDLVSVAKNGLRYARLDYRKGLNKSAHSNLSAAVKAIDEIQDRQEQEQYVKAVEALFHNFNNLQSGFSPVLSLSPTELKNLAFGAKSRQNFISISAQLNPAQFRNGVDKLYSEALALHVPKGMEKVHQTVIAGINEGRMAAVHFEKLVILNEASGAEANELIDQAYERMNSSNRIVLGLQRQFFTDEIRFRLVQADNEILAPEEVGRGQRAAERY